MKLASGYRTLSVVILMKNALFFFKTIIFDEYFGKYILNMLFCDNIGRWLYFLEYALPTPLLGYCFIVFKLYMHHWFMNDLYITISARKSFCLFKFIRFIYSDKQRSIFLFNLGTLQVLYRHSVGTRVSATQDTRVLKALWYSRNSRNSGPQGTRALKTFWHSKCLGACALRHFRHFIYQTPGYSIHRHFQHIC